MIVVCGEALVDLVAEADGAGRSSPGTCFRARPGGGPANTAVALSRLGREVELWTRLGEDGLGALVAAHLARNGVGLAGLGRTRAPTSLAVVALDGSGEADYRCYLEGTASGSFSLAELPGPLGPEVEALHTGSLLFATAAGRDAVLGLVEREHRHRTVSLDPNVRLGSVDDPVAYREAIEEAVAGAHLVRVSGDDLATLYPAVSPEESARRWSLVGPRLVVVTRGPVGAIALFGDETVVGPVRATAVVDTVAAGDTFAAGLLDALSRSGALARRLVGLEPDTVEAALAFATAAASLACSRAGADPPSAAEVAAVLGA